MPVFNLKLQFNDQGALKAVNVLDKIGQTAQDTEKRIERLGLKWDAAVQRYRNAQGQFASAAELAAAGIGKTSSATLGLGKSVDSVSGSIKALAAQIIGLIGAYKTLSGVASFVKRGMDFSASLESSQIAIASVVAATNNISTAEGKALEGVEKFNAAQELSKGIMDEIQVLALQTTATFDSLADAVAGIVAPATKAGVSIEKMPKFAVMAAQAMTAMKIPVQQMRTEIEALLSGNINKAQDQLATNLGISREMVRNWQQQGILVEELTKRMQAFALAGKAVADSWTGLRGNMEDALNFLAGQSGRGIFEGMKQSYRELLDYLVNTEGKVGVGKDFENIMQLITEIQDAIGNELVTVTRSFIEQLRELNKPENLAEFKQDLKDLWDVAKTAFDAIATAGKLILDVSGRVVEGWQSLPEPIREYGLIMALLGGAKVKAALAVLSTLSNTLRGVMEVAKGNLNFWDFATSNGEELKKLLAEIDAQAEKTSEKVTEAFSRKEQDFVGPPKPKPKPNYNTSSSIGSFGGKNTEADKFAERTKQYQAGLEKLRNEVAALEAEMRPGLTTFERMTAKIDAEREAAIRNADIKKEETIRRGQATRAQAEETAALEKRKAEIDANNKKDALAVQNLKERADFYREMAALSGDYGLSLEYQNQLIQQQAKAWEAAGVPQADVLRRIELMKQELARDPWSGFVRGARKWAAETQDLARGVEQTLTNAFDGAADALANFVMTGKINFQSLANSIISDLARIAARQAIGGIVGGLVSGIGSMFGGGFSWGGTSDITASSGGAGSLFSDIAASGFHSGGMAWEKPDFTRAVPAALFADAPRFHNGRFYDPSYELPAIIRKDESVLTPGQMRAIAGVGGTSHVTVNVVNQTSTPVEAEAQATPDGNGGFDLTMIIREMDRGMMGLASTGRSDFTKMLEKTYGLNRAGVLARGRR